MVTPYSLEIEVQMQALYKRLSEKDRRLYAGIEALKLPTGGISYIARLLGCSRDTVMRGIKEINEAETLARNRSRKAGGGRTPALEKQPDIHEVFLQLLKEHTAGDPMDEKVKWTDLTNTEIAALLAEKGFKVSRNIVAQLLKKHGYVKRKALKKSRPATT
jgi:transposase